MKDAWKLLLVAAGALVLLGIFIGGTRTVYEGAEDCGTAFAVGYSPQLPSCNEALSDARVTPWLLVGLGVAAGVGGEAARRRSAASA